MFARATEVGFARLGVAVSKRNLRLAVQRNRLKRLVRESFRTSAIRDLSLDIVVVPRAVTATTDATHLRRVLELRWDSLRVFINNQAAAAASAE